MGGGKEAAARASTEAAGAEGEGSHLESERDLAWRAKEVAAIAIVVVVDVTEGSLRVDLLVFFVFL